MTFPTPHTVGWHFYVEGQADGHGNTGESGYNPPLFDDDDELVPGTPVKVIFIAPAGSSEPNEVRVEHDLEIGVPPDFTLGKPKDVVDLPEGQFEVDGFIADYTRGPWGFMPGKVAKLKQVQW